MSIGTRDLWAAIDVHNISAIERYGRTSGPAMRSETERRDRRDAETQARLDAEWKESRK